MHNKVDPQTALKKLNEYYDLLPPELQKQYAGDATFHTVMKTAAHYGLRFEDMLLKLVEAKCMQVDQLTEFAKKGLKPITLQPEATVFIDENLKQYAHLIEQIQKTCDFTNATENIRQLIEDFESDRPKTT